MRILNAKNSVAIKFNECFHWNVKKSQKHFKYLRNIFWAQEVILFKTKSREASYCVSVLIGLDPIMNVRGIFLKESSFNECL